MNRPWPIRRYLSYLIFGACHQRTYQRVSEFHAERGPGIYQWPLYLQIAKFLSELQLPKSSSSSPPISHPQSQFHLTFSTFQTPSSHLHNQPYLFYHHFSLHRIHNDLHLRPPRSRSVDHLRSQEPCQRILLEAHEHLEHVPAQPLLSHREGNRS